MLLLLSSLLGLSFVRFSWGLVKYLCVYSLPPHHPLHPLRGGRGGSPKRLYRAPTDHFMALSSMLVFCLECLSSAWYEIIGTVMNICTFD